MTTTLNGFMAAAFACVALALATVGVTASELNAAEQTPCGVDQPQCDCPAMAQNPQTGEWCTLSVSFPWPDTA